MKQVNPIQTANTDDTRSGVTLTEVLMSMMIMSIGVTSVAVLFPISVLRSVQATQMTNAAILKYNTETMVRMRPELVFDPDGDRFVNPNGLTEHVANQLERRYIVDPGGYFAMTDAGASFAVNPTMPNGSSDRRFADWFGNVDTNGDGIPEPFDDSVAGRAPLPRFDGGLRSGTRSGARPNGLSPNPIGPNPDEARALLMLASTATKLGDGWLTQLDTFAQFLVADDFSSTVPASGLPGAASGNFVGVVLPSDLDLTQFLDGMTNVPRAGAAQLIPDPEMFRVVLFSADGKFSVSYPITQILGQAVFWGESAASGDLNLNGSQDLRLLPAEFIDPVFDVGSGTNVPRVQVGRVMIQMNRPHDFNWLLTVRRGFDGEARGVDVVVTFNKNIAIEDERLYSARFGQSAGSLVAGNERFVDGSAAADPFRVNVLLDGGLLENGDRAEPSLKRGGYLLDIRNARWYRVQSYQKTTFDVGVGFIMRMETPIQGGAFTGKAMFLPGIVDVYPMGSLNLPPEMDL
jgi:prepilin-type N-terminal cleavage/methylation domain-containing protein